jgi:hypothetical protein
MRAVGLPLGSDGPVITDFPIWLAAATGADALALPAESPASVANLAQTFGARTLIISGDDHGGWPAVLDAGGPAADCFAPIDLGVPDDEETARALKGTRVYRIVCP